jgi:hypothetical protein
MSSRKKLRSCTVTTPGVLPLGGNTKLVAWITSTAPTSDLTEGFPKRRHVACIDRAGTRQRAILGPLGPRRAMANRLTSTPASSK